MTSRDLLPALRAVRNQAQTGRFIADDDLLAIAERASTTEMAPTSVAHPSPSPALILEYGRLVRDWARGYSTVLGNHDKKLLALWEQVKASQAKCDPEQLFYRHPGDAATQPSELPKRAECEGTGFCQYCGALLHHWPSPEMMGWHERCAAAKARHDALAEAAKICDAEADAIEYLYRPDGYRRGMNEHEGGRCAAYRTAAALIRSRARAEEGAK